MVFKLCRNNYYENVSHSLYLFPSISKKFILSFMIIFAKFLLFMERLLHRDQRLVLLHSNNFVYMITPSGHLSDR